MDKKRIIDETEKFINDEIESINLEGEDINDASAKYYMNTVKRLVNMFSIYKKNSLYKNDYILALRDYLICFETSVRINDADIIDGNEFGISYDSNEKKYFASLQLPDFVNEKFVREAFLKEKIKNKKETTSNLVTDSKIYNLTGYSKFKSLEQKLGVYGALNTPDGYTTLVSLPTGGGKSLITQTVCFQKEGLTIVIVPTVSLAIDQERVTKQVIKRDTIGDEVFSYSSGVEAEPILSAIKNKTAKVLFISPEALLENPAFFEVVRNANKTRYLKNIVIDEAHIIVDWGAAFRVDYQCLEAWRNMLLLNNPTLRTFLLSATFEDKCVNILKDFFAIDNKWIEIRCDSLRHEPRYCVARFKSNKEKQKNLVDLVRKLPHPMIVYVARPSDADYVKNELVEIGLNNVKTFTGLTRKAQRKKLIDGWVNNEFEIMIATSAFGVGVDKGDVRTVIHTYIPQNANTYYQELGRGGRDSLPCLSVMCLHYDDSLIGKERISKKVLTAEKIVGRWDSMYNNVKSVRLSDNRVFIDTSIKPNYAETDEFDDSPTSDADMNWNVYVILFLRRYNMIHVLEVKSDNNRLTILIKIKDDRLRMIDDVLFHHIENIREKEWDYYSSAYSAIDNAVRTSEKNCLSELFTETYSKVYEYCAGCNAHNKSIMGDIAKFPLKNSIVSPERMVSLEQNEPFGDSNEMIIFAKHNEQEKLLNRLIGKGISLIVIPDLYERNDMFLELKNEKNVLILSLEDMYQLVKRKAFFFISGLVAIIYPENDEEIGQQYVIAKKCLSNRNSTKTIHIVEKNSFINEAGKDIAELIDGPVLNSNIVYI